MYQHNERVLKARIAETPTQYVVEKPAPTLPLYEVTTKPEVISLEQKQAPVGTLLPTRTDKAIPSPVKLSERSTPSKLTFEEISDRAGIKSKKHCTIDCVFSPTGCEECRKGREIGSPYHLYNK